MNEQKYINRTYTKFDNIVSLYAHKMFTTVGRAEKVYALETKEHLRTSPCCGLSAIEPGTTWGGEYNNIWLVTEVTVPECVAGGVFCAIPDVDASEIMGFVDGKPVGIINSKNNFIGGQHSVIYIEENAVPGNTHKLAFECYAGHTCLGTQPYDSYGADESKPSGDFRHRYSGVRFVLLDRVFCDFCFDLTTVLQLARLPQENFVSLKAHECLADAFPLLIADPDSYTDDELRESCAAISKVLAPALSKGSGDRSRGYVGVIGHSHMDTAWLWPVSETIRKCARTYSQALTLMDIYPDYTFVQSSALHLDWMRRYYPDIFEGIKQRVADGRYEPNGGVWVECDCNVTGGEAMVRQFLYGQRYTEKHLGYRSDSFWLPDTFGYNAAIPQIMMQSGIKYFYTTKMSWNDLNNFPADSFRWRGLDGSEVITHLNRMHMMPDVAGLTGAVTGIQDKRSSDMRLAAYGFGDGGGGPTFGMLEYLDRVRSLDGLPKIEKTTITGFNEKLEARRDRLPLYDGELYLEFHRGTLTSMHVVKRSNRLAEIALHDLELLNVLSGRPVDGKRDEFYEIMLMNQFHDILPGTCIPKVYDIYKEEMSALLDDISAASDGYLGSMSSGAEDSFSLFNSLSTAQKGAAVIPGRTGIAGRDAQSYTDLMGKDVTVFAAEIPPMSAVTLEYAAPTGSVSAFCAEGNKLDTPFYKVTFDDAGYISSLIDKANGREIANLSGNAAPLGTLWFGENMPTRYDNWELEDDVFAKLSQTRSLLNRSVVTDGAVEYRIRSEYALGRNSKAYIDTVFYADDRRIDYEVKLDWHDRHSIVKAGFDVNLRSAFIKNEIQFGHVDRPTTRNNSIENARFEVCNHKWSDLSETNYGVALLNDCKYGISCEGSNIMLTLALGGTRPDPFNGFGELYMRYALLPHVGPFNAENVVLPAYRFNYLPVFAAGAVEVPKLFGLSESNIVCEAVKHAEDVEGAYVLRLYECERSATNCTLTLPGAKKVTLTNMLEEAAEELKLTDGAVSLSFRPFEIKTILVER